MTGLVVHVTGEPASGKTTLAEALAAHLRWRGRLAEVLDGDAVRRELFCELGFTDHDRREAVTRTHAVARRLARCGVVAIVAMVSPHAAVRREVRETAAHMGIGFMLVALHADEAVRADRLRLRGVEVDPSRSTPYQPVEDADHTFDTGRNGRAGSVRGIVDCLMCDILGTG